MTGYFLLDSFSPEKLKQILIDKGIQKFSRLRKKVVYRFGGYYWKEFPLDEAIKESINIMPEVNLKNNDDIEAYTIKEQATPYLLNEFPYTFKIMKQGDAGILLVKFDHCLADGIGMIGLLIAMSDNYSLDLYPALHDVSFITKAFIDLLMPFYILYIIVTYSAKKYKKTPFRLKPDLKRSNKKKIGISKYFPFQTLITIAKNNHLTFNDLLMGIISKIAKGIFKDNNTNEKYLECGISINIRAMPDCLDNHKLINEKSGLILKLKLIDDPITEGKEIQKETKIVKSPFMAFTGHYLVILMEKVIPASLISYLLSIALNYTDVIASNVPGPKKEISYNGIKATNILIVPNANTINFFLVATTYNGQLQITLNTDTAIDICAKKFITLIEQEFENIIQKNNK